MHDSGETLTKIAKHYNLSRERIRQVLLQAARRREYSEFLSANPSGTWADFWEWRAARRSQS